MVLLVWVPFSSDSLSFRFRYPSQTFCPFLNGVNESFSVRQFVLVLVHERPVLRFDQRLIVSSFHRLRGISYLWMRWGLLWGFSKYEFQMEFVVCPRVVCYYGEFQRRDRVFPGFRVREAVNSQVGFDFLIYSFRLFHRFEGEGGRPGRKWFLGILRGLGRLEQQTEVLGQKIIRSGNPNRLYTLSF